MNASNAESRQAMPPRESPESTAHEARGPHLWGVVLRTGRFDRTVEFYANAIGLPVHCGPLQLGGRLVALLGGASATVELREARPTERVADLNPLASRLSIRAAHLDLPRLAAHGVTLIDRPLVPNTGEPGQDAIAHVRDPDGRTVQLRWPPETTPLLLDRGPSWID